MTVKKDSMNRREFINRSMKAGVSIVATGTAAGFLYNRVLPGTAQIKSQTLLPDYSVTPLQKKILSIVQGNSRKESLNKAIDLLGGISHFIKKGDRVILKPNIAFASSAELGATTHPDIVSTMITLCLKAGASEVAVLDNPINDPGSCYLLSGIDEAVKKAGGTILLPREDLFENFTLPGGKLISNWPILYKPLKNADKIIGLAPIKNHHRSGASMSMKNWYGLLGGRRNIFHQDINTIITELALMIKPTLVILDGFSVMMTNGPTGGSTSDLKQKNTIIASTNQIAADAYGSTLLNMNPKDLPYLAMAEQKGAGTADYKSLNPLFYKEVQS
jgi:uncharacterized protein (DUF362 family)